MTTCDYSPASSTRSSVSGDVRPGSTSPRRSSSLKEDHTIPGGAPQQNPFRQTSVGPPHTNPFATANNPFVEPGNPFANHEGQRSSGGQSVKDRVGHSQGGAADGSVVDHPEERQSAGSARSSPSEAAGAADAAHSRQSSNLSGELDFNTFVIT